MAGRLVDVVEPAGIEAWQDEVRVGGARTLERLGKVHQLVGEAAGQDATVGVRDGRHRNGRSNWYPSTIGFHT